MSLGGKMELKFIIRRALVSLFFVAIGAYSGYWGIWLLNRQTELGIEANAIDWRYGFGGMVLIGIAVSFILLGVMISIPKVLIKAMRWMK